MSGCRARAVDEYVSRTAYSTWAPQKPTLFDGHYLRNRSTLDIGVLGYIGIVQLKEHSPEVLSIPPETPCMCVCMYYVCMYICNVCMHVRMYVHVCMYVLCMCVYVYM